MSRLEPWPAKRSARFYHHLHSRPASRSTSRDVSPEHSPTSPARSMSTVPSPIFVRRNLSLPHGSLEPPPGATLSTSLSPNQHFLQQHLPPTFPHSPDASPSSVDQPAAAMVIMTPTTQDWKELKMMSQIEGEELDSDSDSSSAASRKGSLVDVASRLDDSVQGSLLLRPEKGTPRQLKEPRKRPSLQNTPKSADFLAHEPTHTPDPGSPIHRPIEGEPVPHLPVFNPIITAPSPHVGAGATIPATLSPLEPLDASEIGHELEAATSNESDASLASSELAGFESIGRRESLTIRNIRPSLAELDRPRSKRELEREKLFRLMDEEMRQEGPEQETANHQRGGWGAGVHEIGRARSLNRGRPLSAGALDGGPGSALGTELHLVQTTGGGHAIPSITRAATLAAAQPTRPSPLHASPMSMSRHLTAHRTPSDTPGTSAPSSGRSSPQPSSSSHTHHDSIKDYSRALSQHHAIPITFPPRSERHGTPSPPTSPRAPRQRDTIRKSLVAGRLVQPFSIPLSTALPDRPTVTKKTSFTSFSPFRSPGLYPVRSNASSIPSPTPFLRGDSSVSLAASIGAPSEIGTPVDEAVGGAGGRGIDDYVILREAGKGAYGLVMRAKVKGPKGEPVGVSRAVGYMFPG